MHAGFKNGLTHMRLVSNSWAGLYKFIETGGYSMFISAVKFSHIGHDSENDVGLTLNGHFFFVYIYIFVLFCSVVFLIFVFVFHQYTLLL